MISQNCTILYDELLIQQSNLLQKSMSINDEKESKKLSIEINNINSLIKSLTKYFDYNKYLNK